MNEVGVTGHDIGRGITSTIHTSTTRQRPRLIFRFDSRINVFCLSTNILPTKAYLKLNVIYNYVVNVFKFKPQ